MVEQLELTDQDVSAIANMIDSEIQYHIPSWNPSETPVSRHEASPMANDSVTSTGSLAL